MLARTDKYNQLTAFSDDFITIYEAAKSANHAHLKNRLAEYYYLDIRDSRGLFTPAGMLAREGNHAAVLLLIEHGADAGEAAMGAASVGDIEFAEVLRRKYGACIASIARGAAMFENQEYAQRLLARYPGIERHLVFGNAFRWSMYGDVDARLAVEAMTEQAYEKVRVHMELDEVDDEAFDEGSGDFAMLIGNHSHGLVAGIDLHEVETDARAYLKGNSALAVFFRNLIMQMDEHGEEKAYSLHHFYLLGAARGAGYVGAVQLAREVNKLFIQQYIDGESRLGPHFFAYLCTRGNVSECMDESMTEFVADADLRKCDFTINALRSGHIKSVLQNIEALIPDDNPADQETHTAYSQRKLPAPWVRYAAYACHDPQLFFKLILDKEINQRITTSHSSITISDVTELTTFVYPEFMESQAVAYVRFITEVIKEMGIFKKKLSQIQFESFLMSTMNACSREQFLHILTFANSEIFNMFPAEIKDKSKLDPVTLLVHDAGKIRRMMDKYNFDYDQAHEYVFNHDLRRNMSLMIFKREFEQFPADVNIRLLTCLSPLSHADIHDMVDKYRLVCRSQFFVTDKHIKLFRKDRKETQQQLQQEVQSLPALQGLFTAKLQTYRAEKWKKKTADAIERHLRRLQ